MLERFEEFTLLINKINKDIKRIKLKELKNYGLKGAQLDFIYYLGKNSGLQFKEICKVINADKAFVSRNISLLKEQDLVIESHDSNNKIVFRLNKRGEEIFEFTKKRIEEIAKKIYIDDIEKEIFYKHLKEISKSLSEIGE